MVYTPKCKNACLMNELPWTVLDSNWNQSSTQSTTDEHLGCSHSVVITHNAVMYIHAQVFHGHVFNSVGYKSRSHTIFQNGCCLDVLNRTLFSLTRIVYFWDFKKRKAVAVLTDGFFVTHYAHILSLSIISHRTDAWQWQWWQARERGTVRAGSKKSCFTGSLMLEESRWILPVTRKTNQWVLEQGSLNRHWT